jgi:hypothetical protein
VLEYDNPAAVGMTGLLGWGGAQAALADCDLLLLLGTDFPYRAFLESVTTVIQVDEKPLHLGRRANIELGLVGDVGETLRALLPRLEARSDSRFLDAVVNHHQHAVKHLQTYVEHQGSGDGLRPEMVAAALSDLADDDAVFAVDTGMCNVWGARYLQMKAGRRILASFSHGSMANSMPQALGAKIGSPDRQVIALCGDGGFAMLMGELLTVAGFEIPAKLMVFNNSTLGMVRAEMMVVGYEPLGTDVINPRLRCARLCRGAPRRARREAGAARRVCAGAALALVRTCLQSPHTAAIQASSRTDDVAFELTRAADALPSRTAGELANDRAARIRSARRRLSRRTLALGADARTGDAQRQPTIPAAAVRSDNCASSAIDRVLGLRLLRFPAPPADGWLTSSLRVVWVRAPVVRPP